MRQNVLPPSLSYYSSGRKWEGGVPLLLKMGVFVGVYACAVLFVVLGIMLHEADTTGKRHGAMS